MMTAYIGKEFNCICDVCKNNFYKPPSKIARSKTHTCSIKCRSEASKTKVFINCKQCNKEFFKTPAEIKKSNNNNFCSRSCSASFNNKGVRRNGNDPSNCLNCGEKLKESVRKFCSNKCQGEHQRQEKINSIAQGNIENHRQMKKYLIATLGNICSVCNLNEWCGSPMPLVMDHIDGNSENNHLSNLRLVCGNCDMLLPTYKSKNKGNGRAYRRERYANGKSY
jgi:hypothetical protein